MSKVYLVQRVQRKAHGVIQDAYDLTPAAEFGDLVALLSPSAQPFTPVPVIAELNDKLRLFNDDDWLLCMGSPILIGWATAIAAYHNKGKVQMLQWHGLERRYIPIKADLNGMISAAHR